MVRLIDTTSMPGSLQKIKIWKKKWEKKRHSKKGRGTCIVNLLAERHFHMTGVKHAWSDHLTSFSLLFSGGAWAWLASYGPGWPSLEQTGQWNSSQRIWVSLKGVQITRILPFLLNSEFIAKTSVASDWASAHAQSGALWEGFWPRKVRNWVIWVLLHSPEGAAAASLS